MPQKKTPSKEQGSMPEKEAIKPIGLTVDEAAAAMRCQPKQVRKLIAEKGLPARMVGAKWLLSPAAIDAWLASGRYEDEKDARKE